MNEDANKTSSAKKVEPNKTSRIEILLYRLAMMPLEKRDRKEVFLRILSILASFLLPLIVSIISIKIPYSYINFIVICLGLIMVGSGFIYTAKFLYMRRVKQMQQTIEELRGIENEFFKSIESNIITLLESEGQ